MSFPVCTVVSKRKSKDDEWEVSSEFEGIPEALQEYVIDDDFPDSIVQSIEVVKADSTEVLFKFYQVPRLCKCGNKATEGTQCEWCAYPECEIIVTVIGVAGGKQIGTCEFDGRPIFRSHMAGTIYHATEDR